MLYRIKYNPPTQLVLLLGLIVLNIILRYPLTPHAIGWDTFTIQAISNTVTEYGCAKWWVTELSIFGLYPCSYASSVPFIISGISQITDTVPEWSIWFFGVLTGIISLFFTYLLAGELNDSFIFKYSVAFTYSISPGILYFSTWQLSSRGLFISFLPIFIYLLLKIYHSKTKFLFAKYALLFMSITLLLIATHHLFYFLFLVIISVLISTKIQKTKFLSASCSYSTTIILFMALIFAFLLPFFTGLFIDSGGRYAWIFDILKIYIRYSGIVFFFGISGLIYLIAKGNKNNEDWFLLFTIYFLVPFMYIRLYSVWFALIYISLLAGISLLNIMRSNLKSAQSMIIIYLVLFVGFSTYYQAWNTGMMDDNFHQSNDRYMEDSTYEGALWMKSYVSRDNVIVVNEPSIGRRILATSEIPSLTGDDTIDLSYGLVNISRFKISKNSPLSVEYYKDNPYVITPGSGSTDFFIRKLNSVDIESRWGQEIISEFNISGFVEYRNGGYHEFAQSVHNNRNILFDNGQIKVSIW